MRTVTFEIETASGTRIIRAAADRKRPLSDLLRREHLPLNTRCGQRGLCDGCIIDLIKGCLLHASSDRTLTSNGDSVAFRSCEYGVDGSEHVALRIPPRALLAYEPQVCADFVINVSRAHDPIARVVEVPGPLGDGDLSAAIRRAVFAKVQLGKPIRVADAAQQKLPQLAAAEKLWVELEYRAGHWLITDVQDQPIAPPLGVAIDIGTTTVAVLLVDLADGNIISKSVAFNQQMHMGDDVVTRISLCLSEPGMLQQLQQAVVNGTIAPLIAEALLQMNGGGADGPKPPPRIKAFSIAGNTIMLHLLAGVDPSPMGVAPFTPVFLEHRVYPADELVPKATQRTNMLDLSATSIHLLPGAAAYIGADLTAGVIASGLLYDDGPSLLVDVGTNGEMILKHGDRMLGCATAAGPAFEGARLSCGIRAGEGAVSHIDMDVNPFHLKVESIPGPAGQPQKPITGLCGSAYIDFLAQAWRCGLITATGRFNPDAVADAAGHFMHAPGRGSAFRIGYGLGERPIYVAASDIASLLQAKAAIAAGVLILLEHVGMKPADVKTLYLAGGFGTHMRAQSAIDCGLLPGFKAEQIKPIGNSSIAGAYLAMLDANIISSIAGVGMRLEVVELNLDPQFEERFIEQLALPDRGA